ncbi:MAG TPA: GspH/FimT family pseudopilin [bacterium]|nr:GspH/FimT family pseudopilin [bacterium]
MASHAGGARGFSLLEVALVLPLIGVLTAAGAMSMRQALAREEIDGWVRSMTYDIAAGRQAAITRRATATVGMATANAGGGAPEPPPGAITSYRIYTIGVSGGGTVRQATLPSDISMTTTCPAGSCSFDRRGIPIAAGTITVTSASTGRSYTITIEAGTGRVSYSEP